MALKTYQAATPSLRSLVQVDRSDLWKGKPVKKLTEGKNSPAGHDNLGHITSRFRCAGHKKRYRFVDFKRNKFDVEATVERIEYDPNRTAYIALITYKDGEQAYIIAPQRLEKGDKVISSANADIKPGNTLPLKNIPVGTVVHNVEMKQGKGGQIARSAGSFVQLVGKDSGFALVRLRSGEVRKIDANCLATIGAVSNPDHQNRQYAKAGRMRWLGRRPHQRGISMNAVDHPMGGRTNGGRHPCSPWGQKAKGLKTRHNKKTEKFIVSSRHKTKKTS